MKNKKLTTTSIKVISALVIAILVSADQIIKYYIDLLLKPIGNVVVIPKVLQLSYYENDGAMMGMMSGKTTFMTIFSVVCLLVIGYVLYTGRLGYGLDFWCIVIVTAGGAGNLIDRIFRGYVIDYIEALFVDFYIFNFADCLVTCAAGVIIISQIYQMVKESKKNKQEEKLADD